MHPAVFARPGDLVRTVAVTAAKIFRNGFRYGCIALEVKQKCRACLPAYLLHDNAVSDKGVKHSCDGVPMPTYSLAAFRFRQTLILSDDFNATVP
jgi:hypothetical protein